MSKNNFDTSMFDEPISVDNPPAVSEISPTVAKRGRSYKAKQTFDNPVTASARRDVAKASGKGGEHQGTEKHQQLTFRIPWDWVDEIERWADELGVSKEEMKRYLVRRGLDALGKGERPRVKPHVVRNVVEY